MPLRVHDELIFEMQGATAPVLRDVMQTAPLPAVWMSVPLQVDARAATNWHDAH